jgi:hypothetical protein
MRQYTEQNKEAIQRGDAPPLPPTELDEILGQ